MEERTGTEIAADQTLLTRNDLYRRWAVSFFTVQKMERDGLLKPFFLLGSEQLVRYRTADVLEFERNGIESFGAAIKKLGGKKRGRKPVSHD